jgi:hypothetical protein
MQVLTAKVLRVCYPPATAAADAWYIIVCDIGTIKGKIPWRPNVADVLEVSGEWKPYNGEREFRFTEAILKIPDDPRAQLKYVCERTIGIGPKIEAKIWTACGAAWKEKLDTVPIRAELKAELRVQIGHLEGKQEEANAVAYLMSKGCTSKMGTAAWAKWGKNAIGIVASDCYRLSELDGYGFADVDAKIRKEYGIADDDPRRIKSGVIYALRRITDRGDTFVLWEEFYRHACGLLKGFDDLITECTSQLFLDGTLKAFEKSGGVALAADFAAECEILDFAEMKG